MLLAKHLAKQEGSFFFATAPHLRIKAHFPQVDMVDFSAAEGKKLLGVYSIYITLQDFVFVLLHIVLLNMIILELRTCGWCWCELVYPVPMLTAD